MVLTGSFVLFLVIGRFVTIPVQCEALSRVDASVEASEPHDFTVRGSSAFVLRAARVHRIPRPTSVTIAIRPSSRARDGRKTASDLPDATSENACGRLAGRA